MSERRGDEIGDLRLLNDLALQLLSCTSLDDVEPILAGSGKDMFPGLAISLDLADAPRTSSPGAFCLPLRVGDETIGHLILSEAGGQLTIDDATAYLAVTVAAQVALTVTNLRLRDQLHERAIRDPLTGLFNRGYLQETLEREVAQTHRDRTSLGIVQMDIDHFKRFNDEHGHDAGDRVMRAVGVALLESSRAHDVVCRYGGEEFTWLLPGASLPDTVARAESLRARGGHSCALPHRRPANGDALVRGHRGAPRRIRDRRGAPRGCGPLRGQGGRPRPDRHRRLRATPCHRRRSTSPVRGPKGTHLTGPRSLPHDPREAHPWWWRTARRCVMRWFKQHGPREPSIPAFTQCAGCSYDFVTGEGTRNCHWSDCPYLPEQYKVFCPSCNYNFATGEGQRHCADPKDCQWAAEGYEHARLAKAFFGSHTPA